MQAHGSKPADEPVRERLLSIALSLFNSKGYTATTTWEIAKAAGVSEQVLYRYFKTKGELFLELYHNAQELLEDALRHSASSHCTACNKIKALASGILDCLAANEGIARFVLIQSLGPEHVWHRININDFDTWVYDKVRRLVREGIDTSEIRHVNVEHVSWIIMSLIAKAATEQFGPPPRRMDKTKLVRTLDEFLTGDICA